MADDFTPAERQLIRNRLGADESRYGLPERRAGSVVLASFNIRKCGNPGNRSAGARDLMAHFIRRCDLVAVQEVLADLRMVQTLREKAAADGSQCDLVVSDVTGGVTGGQGMEERLAFLYRPDRLIRGPVVGDISYDRSAVLRSLYEHRGAFMATMADYADDMQAHLQASLDQAEWELDGKQGKKPKGKGAPGHQSPEFLTFIRTPHMASFDVPGAPGAEPYRLSLVNAHLLFGGDGRRERVERENEFHALIAWMLERVASTRSMNRNYILLGDLNLAFDKADAKRRKEIIDTIKEMNDELSKAQAATVVNFPFIDERKDPRTGALAVIRTNARQDQTFDQIGIFAKDARLPSFQANLGVADDPDPDAFDYQLFNFADLFAEAVLGPGTELSDLDDDPKADFIDRFQHDFSDHMPIWIRLPLPA